MSVKKDESIQKNPYYYRFEVNGKPYKKRGFRTKAEALKAEATAKDEVFKGTYITPSKTPFGDYLVEWLKNRNDLRDNTKRMYSVIISKHIIPASDGIPLANINAMTVESIMRKVFEKGLSESFNRNVFKVIHKSLKDATNKGLIQINPAEKVAKPRVSQKDMAHWSSDEVKNFLVAVSKHRLSVIFVLAIHCGLRQSEILGLRMSDIDWKRIKFMSAIYLTTKKSFKPERKLLQEHALFQYQIWL
jgi:integrase